MTVFERNARYSYSETLNHLIGNGWRWPHLRTCRHNGYEVITYADSNRTRGFHAKFFLNGKLVKMRDKIFKANIEEYCKNYIDQVLVKENHGTE